MRIFLLVVCPSCYFVLSLFRGHLDVCVYCRINQQQLFVPSFRTWTSVLVIKSFAFCVKVPRAVKWYSPAKCTNTLVTYLVCGEPLKDLFLS